ncbi:MAG: glycosyltransferase, partial [Actinobacteria bacterium]
MIEHEFGIFGGPDGEMLLGFVDGLDVPFVVSLHTVLPSPTANQKRVLRRLCERAAAVMVFTATARRILLDQGVARAGKVRIVPHGAPSELFERRDADDAKSVFGVSGRPVVSTFGLLSSGKGIEVALRAVDSVRDVVPDVVYIVAGQTHPGVLRVEGERYREELLRLVDALDLADNVRCVGRFMEIDDLAQLLSATDVFCTPYHNGDQIVSGALTFAIAAGRPTVSTPYRYAEDLLGDGAGRLVPFDSPEPLAVELVELLTCPEALARAQRAAERTGASLSWPEVGRHTADVLWEAMQSHRLRGWTPRFAPAALPQVDADLAPVQTSTAHLRAMVDDTGIFQHAHGQIPALEHGYCVDDVARLLPIADALSVRDPMWADDAKRALAFLRAAADPAAAVEREGAGMRNFLSWDRQWLDSPHTGDHVGRTMWAVGEVLGAGCAPGIEIASEALLRNLVTHLSSTEPSLRTSAYAALGLAGWGPARPPSATGLLHVLVGRLTLGWRDDAAWPWPEDRLTYDNARICEALIRGGAALAREDVVHTGLLGLEWLDKLFTDPSGVYRFAGNRGLGAGEEVAESGDEQPLEAV